MAEVHRAPFFQGLNLDNPFKNEFEHDFEMTKNLNFPSFSTQLDYDYNPYDSAPVNVAPAAPPPQPARPPAPAPMPVRPAQEDFQVSML